MSGFGDEIPRIIVTVHTPWMIFGEKGPTYDRLVKKILELSAPGSEVRFIPEPGLSVSEITIEGPADEIIAVYNRYQPLEKEAIKVTPLPKGNRIRIWIINEQNSGTTRLSKRIQNRLPAGLGVPRISNLSISSYPPTIRLQGPLHKIQALEKQMKNISGYSIELAPIGGVPSG